LDINSLIQYLTIALTFIAVSLIVLAAAKHISTRAISARVGQVVAPTKTARVRPEVQPGNKKIAGLMEALSRLSVPEDGWQSSALKLKFIRAGFRSTTAPRTYYAVKTLLFVVAPLFVAAMLLLFAPTLGTTKVGFVVLLVAALGYYLPDLYLRVRTSSRVKEMQETLPDLLDLLVISIESGLGLDSALNRVSKEIVRSSPVLAEEFYLAGLEIRAGSGRIPALKNLALRVNLEDLSNLVAMLIQADKFGTSLGASLRIQSEVMRVKRMQRAEEIAAKIPVKMLFPLVFFVFPALLFVILGPAAISMSAVFGAK
jgi:tight adherence protein C